MLVTERYFAGDRWRGNLDDAGRRSTGARRDAMLEALDEHFPDDATWTRPAGGFYVWVTLPEWFDTQAMLAAAVERRVAYVPGTAFYPDGRGKRPDAAGVLLPHRGPDPRRHRAPRRAARGRGAALPVACIHEGRGPRRRPDPRARRLAALRPSRADALGRSWATTPWLVDPGEVAARRGAPGARARRLLPHAARQGGRGRHGPAAAGSARHPLHGHGAVRLRGRLRQGPGEGRAGTGGRADTRRGSWSRVGRCATWAPERRSAQVDRTVSGSPAW